MSKEQLYWPLGTVLVRTPALPLDSSLPSPADLANGSDGQRHACDGDDASCTALARLAISTASVGIDLAFRSHKAVGAIAPRLHTSLGRYLRRMSHRPTPYGLFAGVSLAQLGEFTDLEVITAVGHSKTRIDMGALSALVDQFERSPSVVWKLKIFASDAIVIRGDRVWLLDSAVEGSEERPITSVRASRLVIEILDLARNGITVPSLIGKICTCSGQVLEHQIKDLIIGLLRAKFLVSELRPPLTVADPAAYVLKKLELIPDLESVASVLKDCLRDMAAMDAAIQRQKYNVAERVFARLHRRVGQIQDRQACSPVAPTVQMDLATKTRGGHVSAKIGEVAAEAAQLLLLLNPNAGGPSAVDRFRRAFIGRYGVHQRVPVLEALDPGNCLLQLLFENPEHSRALVERSVASVQRDRVLLEIAGRATRLGETAVTLNDTLIDRLAPREVALNTLPSTLDVALTVSAESAAALDCGEFLAVVTPSVGAGAAGRYLSRFADLLGDQAVKALWEAERIEASFDPTELRAELLFAPWSPRSANVARRPQVRLYQITSGMWPSEGAIRIPCSELQLGIDDNRVRLYWGQAGQRVKVCLGTMLNPAKGPALFHALSLLADDGVTQLAPFDWGSAAALPFLPRIQCGRVILQTARWLVTRRLLHPNSEGGQSRVDIDDLNQWRGRWFVPRHVLIGPGDNKLSFDTEDSADLDAIVREINSRKPDEPLIVEEAVTRSNTCWLLGPRGRYVSEVIVSLARTTESQLRSARNGMAGANRLVAPSVRDRIRAVGSDWLFMKIAIPRESEEDFLRGPWRLFAEDLKSNGLGDCWFFVRYSDPQPHLRIRFQGKPMELIGRLLPRLCEWGSGMIHQKWCSDFSFDTYSREVERYGGQRGSRLAESIFVLDSSMVIDLLRLFHESNFSSVERFAVAAASVDKLLQDFGLSPEARLLWYQEREPSRVLGGPEFRISKSLLRSLMAEDTVTSASLCDEPLARLLAERSTAVRPITAALAALDNANTLRRPIVEIAGDVVHMHVNRIFGVDTDCERLVIALARRGAVSLRCATFRDNSIPLDRA